jgi:hypothetical protein
MKTQRSEPWKVGDARPIPLSCRCNPRSGTLYSMFLNRKGSQEHGGLHLWLSKTPSSPIPQPTEATADVQEDARW